MADVLTHVLVGYTFGTLLSFRYEWIRTSQVTLVMVGALSPDLMKIGLVLKETTVEAILRVPFDWRPLHVLGGNLVIIALGALLVAPEYRKHTFVLLALGAALHHSLDLLLLNASGYAYPVLWPLTEYRPPAGMLYRSSDRWPTILATIAAVAIWTIDRYSFADNATV